MKHLSLIGNITILSQITCHLMRKTIMTRRISSEPSTEFQTIGEQVLSQLVTHADKSGDRIPGKDLPHYHSLIVFRKIDLMSDVSVRAALVAQKIPGGNFSLNTE